MALRTKVDGEEFDGEYLSATACSTTGSSEAAMLSGLALERGWQVPAYTFPEDRGDLVTLRVVVRNGYSRDPADMFLDGLKRLLGRLEKQPSPAHDASYTSFSH